MRKYKSGFAPIIILILLVLIGVGAYYFGTLKNKITVIPSPSVQPTSSPVVAKPTADPTANWKIYTDPLNKFEFKYPNDWTSSKDTRNKEKYTQLSDSTKTLDSAFYNPDQIHAFWVRYINYPSGESLDQIIKSGILDTIYGSLSITYKDISPKFTVTTVNGYQVYQPDDNTWPSRFGIKTVFIKNQNDSYVSLNLEPYDSNSPNLKGTFDQILSTFKFTR